MMNLYDQDDGFRKFTISEVNKLLPDVINLTESVVQQLEDLKRILESERARGNETEAQDTFEQESVEVLEGWAHDIVELGGYPKGYFTVDFKSHVPDTLLCWTYGEQIIGFTHKTYQTFKDRVPIDDADKIGFEESLN